MDSGCELFSSRSPPGRIRGVFFDAGQTLLRVKTSVGTVYAETACDHGIVLEPEEIAQRFRVAWARGLERSRARGYRTSDAVLKEEWLQIVRETFPPDVPAAVLRRIFDDLYSRFSSAHAWGIVEGARETLAALRELGVGLGVLSNWDSRLPRMLEELGIRQVFDVLVVSYQVGFEKPHPEIFRHALRAMGTAPHETLHVGDSFEADILPARALGMRTLWLAPQEERRRREHGGSGADDLSELPPELWRRWTSGDDGQPGGPVESTM